MKKNFIVLVFALVGQSLAVTHDLQSWTLLTAQGHLTKNIRLYTEAQPRLSTAANGLERLLIRAALGYQVTPAISLWAGYAWTPLFSPGYLDEQRPFAQLLFEHHFGRWSLVNRSRLEERWVENHELSLRFRHLTRVAKKISEASRFSLVGYQEIFFNLNQASQGPDQGFDQSRLFLGVNYKPNAMSLEVGYLNNMVHRTAPKDLRMGHVLMTAVNYTF